MSNALNHRDCLNFAPVDVTKGICHRSKELVQADLEACSACLAMPKCKNCKAFVAAADLAELGVCGRSTQDPKFFAYPDMAAVTCREYQAR